ncbi:hypothetical protein LCGC14_1324250 [marine sediment metagenome]|uniref:DNA recombination protein RmuC n=1 Tax=marine sediment metagenome TaxID=412755 RepID=A0A0F9NKZ1_9ZZZZ
MEVDGNVVGSIIGGLIALIGLLATAVFVAIRRNGDNSAEEGNVEDIVKQMLAALTGRDDVLRQMLVSQEGMAGLQRQINDTLRDVKIAQSELVKTTASLAETQRVIAGTIKEIEDGLGELVLIHVKMEERAQERQRLGKMVDEGGHG